ncbi:MAG: thiamine phosphate synthase [Candidatus Tyrphobacter sp.]
MDRESLLRGIYLIVNESPSMLDVAGASLSAGVRIVQYRAKGGIDPNRLRSLRTMTKGCGAILLVNDDWRSAREYGCDGVHLGPGDQGFMHAGELRAHWPDAILGFSCGSVEETRAAMGADYVGVGPVFATHSKSDAGDPIGIAGLRRVAVATALPVTAIGGITQANVGEVRGAGVAMAAVLSAIASAHDPHAVAAALVRTWAS